MAKGDKFYFENFLGSVTLSKNAAEYLVKCLENYRPESIEKMLEEMHHFEHSADLKKHEMNEALAKAFVTPVDREDLAMLSQNLDEIADKIEEALQKFYIYNILTVEPAAVTFAKNLVRSCDLLCQLMGEFENFKKSKKIQPLIIAVNDVEEECDKLYLSSMRELTLKGGDQLVTASWREIYECLESCADACEHVGEAVGTVIMKNT